MPFARRTRHQRPGAPSRSRRLRLIGTLAVAGGAGGGDVSRSHSVRDGCDRTRGETGGRIGAVVPVREHAKLLNSDYGDTREMAGWDPGEPDTNSDLQTAYMHTILDVVKANDKLVLDAGDLVNGHWEDDVLHTGIFGPSSTDSQRHNLAILAGHLYYRTLRGLFTSTFG